MQSLMGDQPTDMSARERNKAKRKARALAKQASRDGSTGTRLDAELASKSVAVCLFAGLICKCGL